MKQTSSWFTLVEILIGMTIFSIGLTAVYLLVGTSISNYIYSRDEVVVSGLLLEQSELIKNIRESNIALYIPWESAKISPSGNSFASWIYMIENDFSTGGIMIDQTNGNIQTAPIKLSKVDTTVIPFTTNKEKFEATRLFLDRLGRYTHIDTGTGTQYASYIILKPLGYTGATGIWTSIEKNGKSQWYIVDTRVIVKNNDTYREYDAKTAITDWVR